MDRALFAFGFAGAHHCFAHFIHHRADIGKVQIDQPRAHHQIGDPFDALIQNIISHAEGFGKRGFFIRQPEQVLVRDDDQRIDHLLQCLDPFFGLPHALGAFKLKRLGDNANGQNPKLPRGLCDNRRGPSSGAAAHSSSDKTHMRSSKMIDNLLDTFFCRCGANLGARSGAETFGDFGAQLHANLGLALLQGLRVGVRHHKVNPV